jgi:hypothetical protein
MSQRVVSLRATRSGPVLGLFELGLSFRLMLSWGVLPPLRTMNDFLACGRDDTDAEDGLLQWKPFALTASEYNRLARDLTRLGHEVSIEAVPTGSLAPSYQEWFSSQLAEHEPRRPSGKRPRRQ